MSEQVLLYSGGLDAFAINQLYDPDTLVFVHPGTEEADKEMEMLLDQGISIEIVNMQFLSEREEEDKVIPYRNTFFALAGGLYGDEVMLGATHGDGIDTADTTTAWASTVEAVLRQHTESWQSQEMSPSVKLPVKSYTKSELVEKLISEEELTLEEIHEQTKSCHYGTIEKGCGECFGCVRRFVAFGANAHLNALYAEDVNDFFQADIVDYCRRNIDELQDKMSGRGTEYQSFCTYMNHIGVLD